MLIFFYVSSDAFLTKHGECQKYHRKNVIRTRRDGRNVSDQDLRCAEIFARDDAEPFRYVEEYFRIHCRARRGVAQIRRGE